MKFSFKQQRQGRRHLVSTGARRSWLFFARIRPQKSACLEILASAPAAADRSPDISCRLFDQLAAEHCPVARVSLAHFPDSGLGWILRHGDAPPPLQANPRAPSRPSTSSPLPPASSPRTSTDPNPNTFPTSPADGAGPKSTINSQSRFGSRSRPKSMVGPKSSDFYTLLSVPLRLCLSHEIPGCCPPALRSPALCSLLSADSSLPWEVSLAAMLVWSCRRHQAAAAAAACARAEGEIVHGARIKVRRNSGGIDTVYGNDNEDAGDYFAEFWLRYQSLLPSIQELSTLLVFSDKQLEQLQDSSLAAEARAWQCIVRLAYDRWIACADFQLEVGGEVPLEEWLWAVACVESRSFGFQDPADGRELHGYVPFFCLANYRPGAPTNHMLRFVDSRVTALDPELDSTCGGSHGDGDDTDDDGGGSISIVGGVHESLYGSLPGDQECSAVTLAQAVGAEGGWGPTADMLLLRLEPGHRPQPAGKESWSRWPLQGIIGKEGQVGQQEPPPLASEYEHQQNQQVFIDYGRKDNRSLMYQYGFVLHGNLYDRLNWGGAVFDSLCRVRRDWVYNMAEQLSREVAAAGVAEAPGSDTSSLRTPGSCSTQPPLYGGETSSSSTVTPAGPYHCEQSCNDNTYATVSGILAGEPVLVSEQQQQQEQLNFLLGEDILISAGGGIPAAQRRFRSVAASIVEACGWRNLRERRLISSESEGRTLAVLRRWVEDQLGTFPSTAEQDARLLSAMETQLSPARETHGAMLRMRRYHRRDHHNHQHYEQQQHQEEREGEGDGNSGALVAVGHDGGDSPPSPPTAKEVEVQERRRVAVEYRLERKLLLQAALTLLDRLSRKRPSSPRVEDPPQPVGWMDSPVKMT